MNRLLLTAILAATPLAFWVVTLVGSERPPSRSRVLGTYRSFIFDTLETINLKDDGTYIQTLDLPSDELVTQKGTWTLEHKGITLHQYLIFIDVEHDKPITPPQMVTGYIYTWSANMLIRNWGSPPYTLKHE